jgi:hypothetical protein
MATVAALGGECSQAVVNDSAVAAAVAVDGARGVDSGASDTADSLGCLPPRLRSLCERYKVTVAEAASLLAWLFTGFSFVIAKRAFDDCSPLVRDERLERRACTREAPGAAASLRTPPKATLWSLAAPLTPLASACLSTAVPGPPVHCRRGVPAFHLPQAPLGTA